MSEEIKQKKSEKEIILECAAKFPARITSWHKDHGATMPPIRITPEGEGVWLNRATRRRMKRTK